MRQSSRPQEEKCCYKVVGATSCEGFLVNVDKPADQDHPDENTGYVLVNSGRLYYVHITDEV